MSELCPSGGEESPGVMESPDEQVPESPTDSNDIDDSSINMPWIKVNMYFHISSSQPLLTLFNFIIMHLLSSRADISSLLKNRQSFKYLICLGGGKNDEHFQLLLFASKFLPSILLSSSYESLFTINQSSKKSEF